jgi:hypothetical protein
MTGAYWFPQEKDYITFPGGGPGIYLCDLAYAFALTNENAIVICPKMLFKGQKPWPSKKKTLQPYKSGKQAINQGDLLDSYESFPGTLLHEMSHLVDHDGNPHVHVELIKANIFQLLIKLPLIQI